MARKAKSAARQRALLMRKQANKPFYLNLTAMVDMFTIMLVFLLLSYSVSDTSFSPPKDVVLPASRSDRVPTVSVKLSISQDEILIDDRRVVALQHGRLREQDLQGLVIFPLFNELKTVADAKTAELKTSPTMPDKVDRRIVLFGDRSIPFSTLKRVLFTAGQAEFEGFRFAVVRREGGGE